MRITYLPDVKRVSGGITTGSKRVVDICGDPPTSADILHERVTRKDAGFRLTPAYK
jgi:hypothetical protein